MYKISVPMMAKTMNRSEKEHILEELKKLNAQRIVIALGIYHTDAKKRAKELEILAENCAFFKEHGFEVMAWKWAFWVEGENTFEHMTSVTGEVDRMFVCPSDETFRKAAAEHLCEIAKTGVDAIMFDDDFRYGCLTGGGFCCTCNNHLAKISEFLGEPVTRELLEEKLLSGGGNRWRDAFLNANGYYMELYAKEMREALDTVNPKIRLGTCTCMSAWDIDGTDPVTISRLFAGKTKPFFRLIGAPYWAVNKGWGNRLQDVIELERMESSWSKRVGIEVFAEGDVYPRPRWNCPSSYLENFDMAMRADGTIDGILKYGLDYTSSVNYETGYAARHVKNRPIYEKIEKYFSQKEACGVRVYDVPQKYAHMEIPARIAGTQEAQYVFHSGAARILACNAIPTTYSGSGLFGIAVGETARHLPKTAFEKGMILDATAARILSDAGIDTGLLKIGEDITVNEEHFIKENEYVRLESGPKAYRTELAESATVHSYFDDGDAEIPASYTYENADGQRFLVYTFDADFNVETLWRNYLRAAQIVEQAEWLGGKVLPAVCKGHPDLYMMCKEKDNTLSVGLWNCFADSILEPVVTLNREYGQIHFINCNGNLEGNKVKLTELPAFGFAGFEVK